MLFGEEGGDMDNEDVGARDFKFGATGMTVIVLAALAFAIFS